MSAELDRKSDGRAAMFSVKETPWHREGEILAEAPDLATAMELAGLNFEVELKPVYIQMDPGGDDTPATYRRAPGFATVRTDRAEGVLGVVGNRYTPLQNADAFGVFEPLLDKGVASLETGGSLRGGRDVWMQVRFNIDDPVVQEVFTDEIIPYGLISNNHGGQRVVTVQETPIRVVCANTLGMAHHRADAKQDRRIRVRHTISVEKKTTEAAEKLWAGIVERYADVARQYQLLKATHLDTKMFRKLVLDAVAPEKPREENQQDSVGLDAVRRARLTYLWENGDGHTGDHSAWEAYNAVTQSLDHDDDAIWRTRGSRVQAMMLGRIGRTKQTVLDNLVDYGRKNTRAVAR